MKLLTKSEVDKAKANQQKRDVEEGLKLAKRVDNLREVAAQEEASLTKFRKETVAKINAEISKLQSTKDTLLSELLQLEKRRKELQKPLDEEWEKVHQERVLVKQEREEVAVRESALKIITDNITVRNIKTSQERDRIILKTERADKLLKDADSDRRKTAQALKNAREVETKAFSLKEEVEKELVSRDMTMAAKERSLDMREVHIAESEAKLEKEWILLEDRKNMVEQRIKKQK